MACTIVHNCDICGERFSEGSRRVAWTLVCHDDGCLEMALHLDLTNEELIEARRSGS